MKNNYTSLKIVVGLLALIALFLLGILVGRAKADKSSAQEVSPQKTTPSVTTETKESHTPTPVITATPEEAVAPTLERPTIAIDNALYTYDDMVRDLNAMQAYYPQYLKVNELARTADNRQILEAIVGNENAPKKIVIQASIHGREHMNTMLVMRQMEELLNNYETGSYDGHPYSQLLNDIAFHIIPMSNPDGVMISQFGIDGIQSTDLKELLNNCRNYDLQAGNISDDSMYWARWKSNARGVDLNRNFASGWDAFQGASQPSFEKYKGEMPASEIETQTILDLAQKTNAICVISYHSAGNLIYWDYGSTGEIYEKDRELTEMVSRLTGYTMQSTIQSSTDAAGCSDYFVLAKEIPAITIENGGGQCPLSINEFLPIWNANQDLLPALLAFYQ